MRSTDERTGTILFIVTASLLALSAAAAIAQAPDDSWVDDVAPVESVIQYYSDDNELKNAARQSVALHTIYRYSGKAIREVVGRRALTAREEALLDRLDQAEVAIEDRMRERYLQSDPDTYYEFEDLKGDFRGSASNRLEILERFAPPIAGLMAPQLRSEIDRQVEFMKMGEIGAILLGSTAFCLVYLLATSIADRRTNFGLQVEESEDRTVIRYQPGRHGVLTVFSIYGSYIAVGLFAGVLLAIGAVMFAVSRDYAWMDRPIPEWLLPVFTKDFWIIAGLVVLALPIWLLGIANFRRRSKRQVVITSDGIEAGGKKYDKKRIREIYVWGRSDADDIPEEGFAVYGGGNAAARAAASGAMHGENMRNSFKRIRGRMGRVSNQVCIDYGEHRRVIAHSLPFQRARLVCGAIEEAAARLHGRVEVGGMVTFAAD